MAQRIGSECNAINQVGVIPYRRRNGQVEVLLITSRTRGRWIIPKGNLEPPRPEHDVAREEAYEESGVRGVLAPAAVGYYAHREPHKYHVKVFLMHVRQVLAAWPEQDERRREWLPLPEARARVDEPGIQRLLDVVQQRLSRGHRSSNRSVQLLSPSSPTSP